MTHSEQRIKPNVHPEGDVHQGKFSAIPHPLPEDHHARPQFKPIPDTGWKGQPSVPSQSGGSDEVDFLNKPPYFWKSEGSAGAETFLLNFMVTQSTQSTVTVDSVNICTVHRSSGRLYSPRWVPLRLLFSTLRILSKTAQTSVRMIKNVDDSLHFFSTEKKKGEHCVPCKVSCNVCRAPIFDEGRNAVLAYPGSFKFKDHKVPMDFQPTAHIFYAQRVMDVPDGIPKWSAHKGESELIEEMSEDQGTMPKYKGKPIPDDEKYQDASKGSGT
ncbi:hypothetical protein PHLCEN_2v11166 [Hermanssonia centrifuga]|uniref:CENP-V/GFA domain-containing protein n=1 Tax=Hermanssonia centrifuga TaxID=98765 RepID=A0A2R6NKM2_9APHY|nr:hypothetical protein PHLCEN_2v11166 [Hermanssonia centrifuga]